MRPVVAFAQGSLLGGLLALGVSILAPPPAALATPAAAIEAIVGVRAEVPGEARTAETLGRERWGSGVVLDGDGLVLTIGYLVLEAGRIEVLDRDGRGAPAEFVAYDHETGFGLVRALVPLATVPITIGTTADLELGDELFVLSNVGGLGGQPVQLADRREFAGSWEYLLDEALFTVPAHRHFGGAALIDGSGRLLGIGSLFVGDAAGLGVPAPGNMFVPIDLLAPIRQALVRDGRREGPPRPWLGLSTELEGATVKVVRVSPQSPAAAAGLRPGDVVLGVGGQDVPSPAALYRAVWALGEAGVTVPLRIRRGGVISTIEVRSIDRTAWLRSEKGL